MLLSLAILEFFITFLIKGGVGMWFVLIPAFRRLPCGPRWGIRPTGVISYSPWSPGTAVRSRFQMKLIPLRVSCKLKCTELIPSVIEKFSSANRQLWTGSGLHAQTVSAHKYGEVLIKTNHKVYFAVILFG